MSDPEHNDWENDPVWKLLDETAPPEPGPFFARDVMREIRLSEESEVHWWQRLLTPKPILAGALGAIAAAILISVNPGDSNGVVETPADPQPTPELTLPQDIVEEEMLREAAKDPSAFTDEELVALLY